MIDTHGARRPSTTGPLSRALLGATLAALIAAPAAFAASPVPAPLVANAPAPATLAALIAAPVAFPASPVPEPVVPSAPSPATLAALIGAPAAFAGGPVQAPLIATPPAPAVSTTTAATAPWLSDEAYYLSLVNCTRTGGWVLSNGTCRGYGTGRYSAYVRPLVRSGAISDKVTRPYAKLIAIGGLCNHFYDRDPGFRLRRAGFVGYAWGENIGCRDGYGTVRAAVLQSHLFFQAERSTNGGHWRNIKNPRYTQIGIGVWHYGNRTRLVTDFYRP